MNGRIFINYRREDDQAAAGRLYDRLLQHFDREQLFMDIEAIEPGVDFVKSLDEQVAKCIAFIAVIGPRWLNARNNDGNPKLDSPTDYVRVEIEFGAQARYPGDPGAGRWRIDARAVRSSAVAPRPRATQCGGNRPPPLCGRLR